jgi:hypothetical protein
MALPRPTRQSFHKKEESSSQQQSRQDIIEPLNPEDFRPSDVFRFEPKPDITIEELAQVFALFFAYIDLNADRFISLESDLQRHFDLVRRV